MNRMPRSLRILVALSLAAAVSPTVRAADPDRVTITVLATTDIHGNLLPHDDYSRKPATRGLALISTLVNRVRQETPHTILIDCGDAIQGTTLAAVHQLAVREGRTTAVDPVILAMNAMDYDAMTLGNHEFNFGLENLMTSRRAARFPWLSANTVTGDVIPRFAPYFVKSVAGIKVAVIGTTPPVIPEWEKPGNIRGLSWTSPVEGVRLALKALEAEKPDIVLVASHGGLDREPGESAPRAGELPEENAVLEIAEAFPKLGAIVYGHTHRREPGRRVGSVLLVQPRNWAQELARIDLSFVREDGAWRLTQSTSTLVPVEKDTPPDPQLLALARPYQEAATALMDRRVAEVGVELSGTRARFEDSALVDAIHAVQLHYAQADVSFTSLFRPDASVSPGPLTVRDIGGLYIYENDLYALEGNGRMVREALENSARYFLTCPEETCATGPLIDRGVMGYSYDTVQGVEYEIDLNRPAGDRIRNLRYHGRPLEDAQPLRLAVNSYRAGGSAGYTMFPSAKVLWRSPRGIRELMIQYYSEGGRFPETADGNWRITPAKAVETLTREDLRGH